MTSELMCSNGDGLSFATAGDEVGCAGEGDASSRGLVGDVAACLGFIIFSGLSACGNGF